MTDSLLQTTGSPQTQGVSIGAASMQSPEGRIGRPLAPLSSEKLRYHGNRGDKKKTGTALGIEGAEALDRVISQSTAANVRKIAAQEVREKDRRVHNNIHSPHGVESNVRRVKDHSTGKGGVVHHTTKSLKRSRNQNSPHRGYGAAVSAASAHLHSGSNQLSHGHDITAVLPADNRGGVTNMRSQSAGVNLSCEGGSNAGLRSDPRQKLPPVLRAMVRGGVGSSSGSIEPIEEGRPLRLGAAGLGAPVGLRLDGETGPANRYIHSAPAVSRSVSLPPIDSGGRGSNGHRHGSNTRKNRSGDHPNSNPNTLLSASAGTNTQTPSAPHTLLTSQTPNSKQPRLHSFGRPIAPAGTPSTTSILQQSFASVVKNIATTSEEGGGGGDIS